SALGGVLLVATLVLANARCGSFGTAPASSTPDANATAAADSSNGGGDDAQSSLDSGVVVDEEDASTVGKGFCQREHFGAVLFCEDFEGTNGDGKDGGPLGSFVETHPAGGEIRREATLGRAGSTGLYVAIPPAAVTFEAWLRTPQIALSAK